jgi:hypothetical protein
MYRAADFGELPITLGDLTDIYVRQAGRPSNLRLGWIDARYIERFLVGDFQRFAEVASKSPTHLRLAGWVPYVEEAVGMSFEDFIALIPCIRSHLPNLINLHIALTGIETAEAFCGTQTGADRLSVRGNLTWLKVLTADFEPPLFNVIRSVAPLLAEIPRQSSILSIESHRRPWRSATQHKVLLYLRG